MKQLIIYILSLCSCCLYAQRTVMNLNDNWHFRFSHEVQKQSGHRVDLPHTWNAQDALSGKMDYKRGLGNYTKTFKVPAEWKGRRLYVRFQGANSVADIFLNGRHLGTHYGGYEAFAYELTGLVNYGEENTLTARVSNSERLDVMPLVGDFNIYGGLYRGVQLLLTSPVCISPMDMASPGVWLIQRQVSDERAEVEAKVALSNASGREAQIEVRATVYDGTQEVTSATLQPSLSANASLTYVSLPLQVERPHLWNGTADPHLYRVSITLWQDGRQLDAVEQPLGLRYYHVDPQKGFFLNGRHLPLHGVCRHQERAEVGNALLPEHHAEDVRLMREMGANAIRLSHYPQAEEFLTLLDEAGIVAWSEIPFVGPGGYADKGFVDSPEFRANGRQQMQEMIRQLYNHPSICFWGVFNELLYEGDNPLEYIAELNDLAHAEDPTRPTTCASHQQGEMIFFTDLSAWNRYDGWYGATPRSLKEWLDKIHAEHPDRCIGISEYGAGASLRHQQEELKQPNPSGWWHPENWQLHYHIENWKIFSRRPFVWGTFVWNMFDFGAAHRLEGDRPGINDKGLVTHDRKTRKDAFYFYKANWNPDPMVWIAGKRLTQRTAGHQQLTILSNCHHVELWLNGKKLQTRTPDELRLCSFTLTLPEGTNELRAVGYNAKGKAVAEEAYRLVSH